MTTLYRPVLISSAEQAEALPRGTIATYGGGNMTLTAHRITSIAAKPDAWNGMDDLLSSSDMVGWAALVPIEAEEETQGITTWPRPDDAPWPKRSHLCEDSAGDYYYRDEDGVAHDITEEMTHWLAAQPVRTRLVTPWEDAR